MLTEPGVNTSVRWSELGFLMWTARWIYLPSLVTSWALTVSARLSTSTGTPAGMLPLGFWMPGRVGCAAGSSVTAGWVVGLAACSGRVAVIAGTAVGSILLLSLILLVIKKTIKGAAIVVISA